MDWYSVRVISGREKKIREAVLREAEHNNLADFIGDILVPSENVIEMRDGKKRVKEKLFYPGYLLINMTLTNETKYYIENIAGVINFIGSKDNPHPLRDEEVKRILGEVESLDGREVIGTKFKTGDAIKVIDGPFIDFTGFVHDVNEEKQKVKVTVSIFGRPTPVELDYLQVEKEK